MPRAPLTVVTQIYFCHRDSGEGIQVTKYLDGALCVRLCFCSRLVFFPQFKHIAEIHEDVLVNEEFNQF